MFSFLCERKILEFDMMFDCYILNIVSNKCLLILQAEVNYLGQFSHPNLVKLIGYCYEDDYRSLVYEYMPCGSLEKHLFRRK